MLLQPVKSPLKSAIAVQEQSGSDRCAGNIANELNEPHEGRASQDKTK